MYSCDLFTHTRRGYWPDVSEVILKDMDKIGP